MSITLGNNAVLKVVATATTNDHDFGGITLNKGTGATAELISNQTVDLSTKNLNNLFNTFTSSSGTLTLSEAQVVGKTVTGAGSAVVKVSGDSSTDFTTILTLNTATNETVLFSGNSTFTGSFGNSSVSINSGVTLTTDISNISGRIVTGAGTLEVSNLDSVLNANFTNATVTTLNATWDGTGTYTGNLTNVDLLRISSGTMTSDASIISGKTINGAGTLAITNLDGTANANLSNITASTITAISDGNVTFTGNLGSANLTVNGNSTFTLGSGANLGSGSHTITSGSTLVSDASYVSGKTIAGAGTVTVTNLDGTSNANLSTLSTTVLNTTWDGTAVFTGNIGNANLTVSSGTMTVSSGVISGSGTVTVSSGATLSADASKISGETIAGTGNIAITNLQNTLNANFSGLNSGLSVTANWASTNASYTGSLANVDSLVIAGGKMSVNDSILGTLGVSGAGAIEVIANDASMNLSNVSVTGGVTIVNSYAGDVSIMGSGQADTIQTTVANLGSGDVINGSGGTDTLTFTDSGTIDYTQFNGVTGVENLQLYSGDDMLTFTNKSSFDTWATKFSTINAGTGTDTVSFSSAVTADLDFSKLNSIETLNFSGANDTITFGTDEFNAGIRTLNLGDGTNVANLNANTSSQVQVNGGSGIDEFVVDFSRISEADYQIDGGAGTDTVSLSNYNGATMSNAFNNAFSNIEELNLTGSGTFSIDAEAINAWLSGSGSTEFTIKGSSNDTLNILTNNTDYKWYDTSDSSWKDTDMTNVGTGSYQIDTNNDGTMNFTLHVM
jgi:hypothetical protein